jgi:putative hydrolase
MDMHTHSIASGHSYSTIKEMAAAAAERGIELLGITEHGPAIPGSCSYLYFSKLDIIPRTLYGIDLMFGAEINILDYNGTLDLPEKCLKKLDIGIAGIHYEAGYQIGSIEENTAATIAAMKNPYVDAISHPDDSRCPLDYDRIAKAAAEEHVLLEVNNHSLESPGRRLDPIENCRIMLKYCRKYGTPVLVSSDAHIEYDIGTFDTAARILAEENFPQELIINNDIPAFKKFLQENRKRRV